MKAWVLHDIGDIRYEDRDIPALSDNDVWIKVKAAGVCGSDIPRIYETGAHRLPIVPGHEFSGVVEGIGKEAPARWLGKRVAVFPKIACGKCKQCQDGYSDMCTEYDYIGSRRDGAFAEYVTAPAGNLMELPENVSFEQAAMIEPMSVAANAVRTGCYGMKSSIHVDRPVAVCGAGPIGMMVVMFLKEAGYQNIFVIGNKDAQRQRAVAMGISVGDFYDSRNGDAANWLKDVSDGETCLYFECVGSNESIDYGIRASAPGGRIILVGNPRSDMNFDRDIYWRILRNQMVVCGIWNSSFYSDAYSFMGKDMDDWHYVLQRLKDGDIYPDKLISHRLSLENLEYGLGVMKDKTEDYCKIMTCIK